MQTLQNRPSHILPTKSVNKELIPGNLRGPSRVTNDLDGSSLAVVRADIRDLINYSEEEGGWQHERDETVKEPLLVLPPPRMFWTNC